MAKRNLPIAFAVLVTQLLALSSSYLFVEFVSTSIALTVTIVASASRIASTSIPV